ncbi:hypothetical protein scyTo_0009768 [Scyliorhinus torazame]|uniref:Uncharacterized protein n=1 Tax=Scyliorhinus torazame TaxID=75743 RepID=A0A401NTA6_SCYTO|nr:hypothetical protein [Scyliorhinus torazame]
MNTEHINIYLDMNVDQGGELKQLEIYQSHCWEFFGDPIEGSTRSCVGNTEEFKKWAFCREAETVRPLRVLRRMSQWTKPKEEHNCWDELAIQENCLTTRRKSLMQPQQKECGNGPKPYAAREGRDRYQRCWRECWIHLVRDSKMDKLNGLPNRRRLENGCDPFRQEKVTPEESHGNRGRIRTCSVTELCHK